MNSDSVSCRTSKHELWWEILENGLENIVDPSKGREFDSEMIEVINFIMLSYVHTLMEFVLPIL